MKEEWVLPNAPLPDARCQALADALRAVARELGVPERDSAARRQPAPAPPRQTAK